MFVYLRSLNRASALALVTLLGLLALLLASLRAGPVGEDDDRVFADASKMIKEGRQTFRYDTFGDEAYWGGELRLHEAVAGQANGGVGLGLSPSAALEVDDLLSLATDLWARAEGFERLEPGIAGV
jgi:hypothetical protein